MQVSPPAVKLQYTLKESPEQPWLGSIQYSPKTNEKIFALYSRNSASNSSDWKIQVLLLPNDPPKFVGKLFYLNDEKATLSFLPHDLLLLLLFMKDNTRIKVWFYLRPFVFVSFYFKPRLLQDTAEVLEELQRPQSRGGRTLCMKRTLQVSTIWPCQYFS